MQIPSELRRALDACLEGVARGPLTERAERISSLYREKAGSVVAVRDDVDALAYAITRSPATYGAVRNVLERLQERCPEFAPQSALDLGAGSGSASWAIAEAWPRIAAITQVDRNRPLLKLGRRLAQEASCAALRGAEQTDGDLTRNTTGNEAAGEQQADVVVLSYMLAEMPEAQALPIVAAAWERCSGALVIVEPGTSAGHRKILAARAALLGDGARILAPCAHERRCPLVPPDWCHFVQRVERSRDHRILKSAELPYEDEKFAYLVAVRERLFTPAVAGRVLARPEKEKAGIAAKLCSVDGSAGLVRILRRDKENYARARKKEWGEEI